MGKDGGAHEGKDKHKGKKTSTRGRRQAYGQEDEQMGKKTNKHMGKKTDEKQVRTIMGSMPAIRGSGAHRPLSLNHLKKD